METRRVRAAAGWAVPAASRVGVEYQVDPASIPAVREMAAVLPPEKPPPEGTTMWTPVPPGAALSDKALAAYLREAMGISVPVQMDRTGKLLVRAEAGASAAAAAAAPLRSSPRKPKRARAQLEEIGSPGPDMGATWRSPRPVAGTLCCPPS